MRDQIRRKLPYGFDDLGEQSVKNIARPIRVFRLLAEGSALEAAPEEPEAVADAATPEPGAVTAPMPVEPEKSVELVFWESIKDSARAADFEAYLKQYPDGAFVDLARTRLEEFASAARAARDPQDREVELAFWESVRESDNPDLLRAYLEKYPDGEFKPVAEIRLRELAAP